MFSKNRNIRTKCKTDGKINIYSSCIGRGFKKLETIDQEELIFLIKKFNLINNNVALLFEV